MPNYYQPEIETMPREEMIKLQNERLVKQVQHVWDNVPYYRKKMEEKGVTPADIQSIDDLHKLPFLTKADLRDAYVSEFSPLPVPPVSVWLLSIRSTISICGKTAAPVLSWQPAAQKKMWCRFVTATVCSPAAPASTAVLTVWAA